MEWKLALGKMYENLEWDYLMWSTTGEEDRPVVAEKKTEYCNGTDYGWVICGRVNHRKSWSKPCTDRQLWDIHDQ